MDKSFRSYSSKDSKLSEKDLNFKEIMLINLSRELNDSTSSSSSVVVQGKTFNYFKQIDIQTQQHREHLFSITF